MPSCVRTHHLLAGDGEIEYTVFVLQTRSADYECTRKSNQAPCVPGAKFKLPMETFRQITVVTVEWIHHPCAVSITGILLLKKLLTVIVKSHSIPNKEVLGVPVE